MKKLLFTGLLLIAIPVMASHIVGGEFELLHFAGSLYRLNLIIYFDELNGDQGARDLNAIASIYRKSDNRFMQNVTLTLYTEEPVGYTQPLCSHGELVTTKMTLAGSVTLPDNIYDDPQGYYVVWQRCCRNYQITNIYSDEPGSGALNDPNSAGQTFYLEFPPVVKNGAPFINSSPRLFPPLNDYACPGKPYYVDFAGVDDDNDSLVYTLVEPLNTFSSVSFPDQASGPYPPVRWKPGYSLSHIIKGSPDLSITPDGRLSATPGFQGLFVFAVKVEQYRDGQNIGESRRDFQMLVVDGCQPALPPQIVGKKLNDITFGSGNTMAVTFDNTVADGDRCIQVRVSDPDSQSALNSFKENISIRVFPINFPRKTNISGILPAVTTGMLDHGSSMDFTICFPQCPFIDGPYQIGIVAYDDACALPLTDTLKVAVTVQVPVNAAPHFITPNQITATINEGDSATWTFEARDADMDSLYVMLVTDGFVLKDAGMTFKILNSEQGYLRGQLHWDAYCDIYDFTKRTNFQVRFMVNDRDACDTNDPVGTVYNLSVILPGLAEPVVDTDLTTNPQEVLVSGLVRRPGESLSFNVTGTQADNDLILLNYITPGFRASDYNIMFAPVSGNGHVVSHFQWDIACDGVDLKRKDLFEFHFVVADNGGKCHLLRTDTVIVFVKLLPSQNSKPGVTLQTQAEVPLADNQMTIELGQPVVVDVLGYDPDLLKDNLTLALTDAKGNVQPHGFSFTNLAGNGTVASRFSWQPDCSIFESGVYENKYTFKFGLLDDHCFNIKGDTTIFTLIVKDIDDSEKPFLPTNVITPNGDNCNDYFAVEGIDPQSSSADTGCGGTPNPDALIALPRDNCRGRFQFIRIYNRWGKEVFESTDRKFRWYALNESAGVYYYLIKFGEAEYKGVVSVRM